jgi:hypothetical protein
MLFPSPVPRDLLCTNLLIFSGGPTNSNWAKMLINNSRIQVPSATEGLSPKNT